MKIAIVINAQRLTDELKEKLSSKELTEKFNIAFDLYAPEPKDIEKILQETKSKQYQAYLIGGGDGTVRQAVQTLIDNDAPLAILPVGTFNLLAKSLNYPNDIEKIFEIIKNNKTKLIDLTAVNDTVIINHAWIGIYFYILKMRQKHKNFIGKSKILKSIFNTLVLFKALPIYLLETEVEGKRISYRTCLVYIGNNEFFTNIFDVGERKTLSSGLMSVTILNVHNRWQLFLCMLHLLAGKMKNSKFVTYFHTNAITIKAKSNLINMVIDGELFKIESPLNFRNYPKQLKVFVP